jgi:DNA-binding transcriptional LysR family regulator
MSTKRTLPKLSSIDLNLLVALDALLREGNVTTAGKRIGLSQPAMSHALARLRELLEDPVLVRQGGVMRATALGQRLAPRAPGVVLELHAHQGRAPAAELERGELDLAVGTFLGSEPGLERELLFTETFACLGSPTTSLRALRSRWEARRFRSRTSGAPNHRPTHSGG